MSTLIKLISAVLLLITLFLPTDARAVKRCENIFDAVVSVSVIGDLRDRIEQLPDDGCLVVNLLRGVNGESAIMFTDNYGGGNTALPDIRGIQRVEIISDGSATMYGSDAVGGVINVIDSSQLDIRGTGIRDFRRSGNGGAFVAKDSATLTFTGSWFQGNTTSGFGGVVSVEGSAHLACTDCRFKENSASIGGGAIHWTGSSTGFINRSWFGGNTASSFACDVNLETLGIFRFESSVVFKNSQLSSSCSQGSGDQPLSGMWFHGSTGANPMDWFNSTGNTYLSGSAFTTNEVQWGNATPAGAKPPSTKDLCNDFGTGAFSSLGYNIAEDGSCNLTDDTDLPNTDAMFAEDSDGLLIPQPGSPAIDTGPTDVDFYLGETLATHPCGTRDMRGVARPQDANGDGVFECDRGAIEIQGAGQIVDGHSAAFFNALRDGEGQYVELINDTTAVVYTFTYRPDGSGPAWFIGVGTIVGNAIVIDEVLRPIGTSFGNDFDSREIENTVMGGQNMIFPDCAASAPGGLVTFSGNKDEGYEAVITRAQRLSHITGCGSQTPHPNAGLSGSYFLPSRNGEGIVVQWLPNGDVLVVFFTYDDNDNQMWVIGIGQANGSTVTMDALYASSYTKWGTQFDPAEVTLSPWGTFTLTWTICGGVQFVYNSTVGTFGSATREYIRLSTIRGTSCTDP